MFLLAIETLPQTGEVLQNNAMYIGLAIIALVFGFLFWRKKKDKNNGDKNE